MEVRTVCRRESPARQPVRQVVTAIFVLCFSFFASSSIVFAESAGASVSSTGSLPAAASGSLDTGLDPNWTLISDRNDIQVYTRHRENSRLKTFRGVTKIQLADEYALSGLLNDYENFPKWLHFVDSATEFDRDNPLLRYMRFGTHLPWPLADREAVLRVDVQQKVTKEEESVTMHLSNRPELLPPDPRYVRFPEMEGIFKFRRLDAENTAEVTYQLVLDPGGYIPTWLANLLLRDAPYFTLERLRRIIRAQEYQGRYDDYLEVRGPGRPDSLPPPRSYIYGNPPAAPIEYLELEQANPK